MGILNVEMYKFASSSNKAKGKIYGRAKAQGVIDSRGLAEHIAEHGSIYTLDVITGVLAALEKCIPELLTQGYNVKLEGLGTFKLRMSTLGQESATKFTVNDVKAIRVGFLADQSGFSGWKASEIRKRLSIKLSDYYVDSEDGQSKKVFLLKGTAGAESGGTTGGGSGDDDDDQGGGGIPVAEP